MVRGSGTKAALGPALVADPGLKPRIAYAPARVAVTGRRVAPPLSESIELPGQNRTMRRLAQAVTTASARD